MYNLIVETSETLSYQEILKGQIKDAIPGAVELAELTGEQFPIEPNSLGLVVEDTIEEMDTAYKGALGKAVWEYFGLPKGKSLANELLEENSLEVNVGRSPGMVRERVYKTNDQNTKLHEMLFPDGQKRFTVSVSNDGGG